jgi:hypothetical protein
MNASQHVYPRALRAARRKVIALPGRGAVPTMRMPIQRGVS